MQVQPGAEAIPQRSLSHIETLVQGLAQRIWKLIEPILIQLGWVTSPPALEPPTEQPEAPSEPAPVDASFDIHLLDSLRIGSIAPPMVLKHFEQHFSPTKQAKIFESLGQKVPLSMRDRLISTLFRASYRDIGRDAAKHNPYLLAPYLERALTKKIALIEQ